MAAAAEITQDDVAFIRAMRSWQASFKISGPGVDMKNTNGSCAVQISWPRRQFIPQTNLPQGTGIYKVLMLVDDLNPGTMGWEYPRFHSAPP